MTGIVYLVGAGPGAADLLTVRPARLFGRAHEEIEYLGKQKIKVQIVPGVTAALAASAELGVSLTQRGVSRSVLFATPRAAPGEAPSNWAAAVAAADTAVLYMAAGMAEQVKAKLLAAGVSAAKPVAVVEDASLEARLQAGTLGELSSFVTGEKPVLVLLGDVYAALAAAREPQRAGEQGHEPGERPLGDRQAEERPVHLRALAAPRK